MSRHAKQFSIVGMLEARLSSLNAAISRLTLERAAVEAELDSRIVAADADQQRLELSVPKKGSK